MGLRQALARALRVVGRRGRTRLRGGAVNIAAYRGYGTREEIFLLGRVFTQPRLPSFSARGPIALGLLRFARRALERGISGVTLLAQLGQNSSRVQTDKDGYFRIHMPLTQPIEADRLWHSVALEVIEPEQAAAKATAEVFVPPRHVRFVVISDIDDTVVVTGVANKLKMMWHLFFVPARSRVPYAGVGAFYRALHAGASSSAHACNPILYVSRGPWSLYEVLDEFFHLHDIPIGPVLFLREWGLTLQRPLPPKAEDHKQLLIAKMLALYAELPIILVGDSGQHDPEIYAQVVREHPRRVAAVYIRNVSRDRSRIAAIEGLAQEVAAAGSTLMLADDTAVMAAHAHERGFISAAGLAEVRREQAGGASSKPSLPRPPVQKVVAFSAAETRAAVARGEVGHAVNAAAAEPAPVVVESEEEGRGRQQAREDRSTRR